MICSSPVGSDVLQCGCPLRTGPTHLIDLEGRYVEMRFAPLALIAVGLAAVPASAQCNYEVVATIGLMPCLQPCGGNARADRGGAACLHNVRVSSHGRGEA
jgi:hypothetical protein